MASSKTLQAIVEIAGSLSPTLGKAAEEASKSLEGINLKAVAVGAGVAAAAEKTSNLAASVSCLRLT